MMTKGAVLPFLTHPYIPLDSSFAPPDLLTLHEQSFTTAVCPHRPCSHYSYVATGLSFFPSYEVTHNEGPHHLHGGAQGWDSKLWSIQPEGTHGSQVTMTYNSADGEEGYPGAVDATLVIAVTDDDALQITVRATTSAPTPINVTHHGYFNLRGHDMEGALAQHLLRVNADTFTAVDASNLPTGDVESSNSVFALEPAAIPTLALVFSRAKELAGVEGIDHNFILHRAENADAKAETPAAVLYDPVSGRILKVCVDEKKRAGLV